MHLNLIYLYTFQVMNDLQINLLTKYSKLSNFACLLISLGLFDVPIIYNNIFRVLKFWEQICLLTPMMHIVCLA